MRWWIGVIGMGFCYEVPSQCELAPWRDRHKLMSMGPVNPRKTPPEKIEMIDDEMARVIRAKSGAQRLRMASRMYENVRQMLLAHLRSQHADWSDQQLVRESARTEQLEDWDSTAANAFVLKVDGRARSGQTESRSKSPLCRSLALPLNPTQLPDWSNRVCV